MKKLLYIMSILAVLTLVSCNREDIVSAPGEAITLIGTPSNFSTTDVYTKAIKSEEEGKITNMSLLIFDSNGVRRDGDLGIETYLEGSDFVFTIVRASFGASYQEQLEHAQVYVFANIPATKKDELIAVTTLDELMAIDIPVDGIDEPEKGFPMMGSIELNLRNNSEEKGVKQIPLVALFSKVVFNISVNPDQMDASDMPQRFQLNNWTVYNVPSKVRVGVPAANGETANVSTMIDGSFTSNRLSVGSANPVSGAAKMSLSFYMPEHKINPRYPVTYPFADTPENQDHKQQFKPVLVGYDLDRKTPSQNATYVELDGTFYDHNNHSHNVVYTIFLGENNYDNFYINRDCQLNNNIVIRGITNNTFDENEGTVSYDWRVDVEKPEYDFGLERETLLDSHWEIRPIRLVLDGTKDEHRNAKIVLEISDPDGANNWIRLEMPSESDIASNQDAYCAVGSTDLAYGKRRYFTNDLVTSTLNSAANKRIELYAVDGVKKEYTIWAYIDENTTVGTDTRKAIVHCRYYHNSSDPTPKQTDDYAFMQRKLYPVSNSGNNYNIEYFEEYLYNFDSKDPYGQTTDGMPWGLDTLELSYRYSAVHLVIDPKNFNLGGSGNSFSSVLTDVVTAMNNTLKDEKKYDFYLTRDIQSITGNSIASGLNKFDYSGLLFTKRILRAADSTAVDGFTMMRPTNKMPESAVEYCLNKNKRNTDGSIDVNSIKWYLPAIDEIEDITTGGYGTFEVFQSNLYWSSQPSYKKYATDFSGEYKPANGNGTVSAAAEGAYFEDNTRRARATLTHIQDGVRTNAKSATAANGSEYIWGKLMFKQGGNVDKKGTYNVQMLDGYPQMTNETVAPDSAYDEGNCPRTAVHRIRCVYKP